MSRPTIASLQEEIRRLNKELEEADAGWRKVHLELQKKDDEHRALTTSVDQLTEYQTRAETLFETLGVIAEELIGDCASADTAASIIRNRREILFHARY